jgi:hypothetical protein
VTLRFVNLLRNGDQDLSTQQADGLVLLLGLGGVETEADLLKLAIDLLPPRGFLEDLGALTNLLRCEDGSAGDLLGLDGRPSICSELSVVRIGQLPGLVGVGANNRMDCFAEKSKELVIGRPEEIESAVVEHPVVFPIAPVDTVLMVVSGRVTHAVVGGSVDRMAVRS